MKPANFESTIEEIVKRDPRYHRDAYTFVREALDYTQKTLAQSSQEKVRHITGQELLSGIKAFALHQFGPMALLVLEEWGVKQCEDFGELVFNMVESDLLAKTEQDSRNDFKGGYDFTEAFKVPFLPSTKVRPAFEAPPTIQSKNS